MKASLKFRESENKKPQFKAKVPLNILGFPFQSTLSTADSKDISLSLATFFPSGPSFRFSYRPNDAFNPFSIILKSGIGHLGSPLDAPMTISAEFNFTPGNYHYTPVFMLHFKPRFGDFALKKSHRSTVNRDNVDGGIDFVEDFSKGGITSLPSVKEAVAGMEVGANTSLPIRNGAVLKLGWGMRFPEGFQTLFSGGGDSTAGIWPRRIPSLVLNKIGIEHVAKEDRKKKEDVGPVINGMGTTGDVAETCFFMKRQLETLRSENVALGKALEDLRAEFGDNYNNYNNKRRGERKLLENKKEIDGVVIDDISKA